MAIILWFTHTNFLDNILIVSKSLLAYPWNSPHTRLVTLLAPPHERVPCAWPNIGAHQPLGATNLRDRLRLPCNLDDGMCATTSCIAKQVGSYDPKNCRDFEDSPPLLLLFPPLTSTTRYWAMTWTFGIVGHASCTKNACNICRNELLSCTNDPWMGWTSF